MISLIQSEELINETLIGGRIPIMLWVTDLEQSALLQVVNLSNLPFAFHHIAIMPDSHTGYGMPIGGVLATENCEVIPYAVGSDISCGMCALKTPWFVGSLSPTTLKTIMNKIRMSVPLIHQSKAKARINEQLMPVTPTSMPPVLEMHWSKAVSQLGTLGGGNHFIEIQAGSDGYIWIMIHSGSRNLGKQVCDYYNKRAIMFNKMYHSQVPTNWQLAFFPREAPDYDLYMTEMNYCVEYSYMNRQVMMENICEAFNSTINHQKVTIENMINISHNFARIENHFGKNVMVHRKGATPAYKDQLGIIPGSQGTKSYIVKGKGNRDSFMSCSHGAGRIMGRKQAQRELDLETEQKRLDDLGIIHALRHKSDLDEAAGAYKDIDVVMENQKDLVDIEVELTPMAVIKG